MTFETVLFLLAGVVAGLVVGLKVIAPRTRTTLDDRALAILEAVLPFLPKDKAAAVSAALSGTRIPKVD